MKKLMLFALVLCSIARANCETATIDGVTWTYTVADGTARIGGGDDSAVDQTTSGAITIPSTLGGCPVRIIGKYAFCNCKCITSVTIPDGVTSIGASAFSGCNSLTNMVLPFVGARRGVADSDEALFGYIFGWRNYAAAGTIQQEHSAGASFYSYIPTSLQSVMVTDETIIGYGAFSGCSGLKSVILPATVTNIQDKAFYGCSELASVTIPDGVTHIGDMTFRFCVGLVSIIFPPSIKSIGRSAFESCYGLVSVSLPEGVTRIGDGAFWYCRGLTTVSIPPSVTNIGNEAFVGCGELVSVSIPMCVKKLAVTFPDAYAKINRSVICGGVTNVGSQLFLGCGELLSVVIPDSVKSIDSGAFKSCTLLKEVHVDDLCAWMNIKFGNPTANPLYYAHHLYLENDEISNLTIPETVTNIGSYAFVGWSGLVSVTIPACVTNIGVSAFENCTSLVKATIPEGELTICDRAFRGCRALPDDDGDGYIVFQDRLIGYCQEANAEITGLDDIVEIYDGALSGCKSIERIEFTAASRLSIIGDATFKECTELGKLTLPPSLRLIGDEAFMGCSYLSNVIIPGSVSSVGDRAFKNCTGFTAALIEHGVMSLGEECFYGDWQITEVDIPSTVATIGNRAFGGDSSIVRVGLRGDCREMKNIFSNYKKIREAIVKHSERPIMATLFSGCSSLKAVRFQGDAPAFDHGSASGGSGDGLVIDDYTTDGFYKGTPSSLVTYVEATSTGWDGTVGSHVLPQSWPLSGLYRRSIAYWDVPTYLCRFDANGGTLGVQDTYQQSEKCVALPPEPVQSGYKFAGWWTQPDGGLRVTEKTIFIEGVYTYLWAHWVKGHTVFLDPNGGEVISPFVVYVDQSVYGALPMAVKSGYAFDGWTYKGVKITSDAKLNEESDHTLTAQWVANQYKVRYHPNGGSGNLVMENWIYGETQTLRRNAFERKGFVFTGWSLDAGATEPQYQDCEELSNMTSESDGVVDLWAIWKQSAAEDPTNVSFSFGGDAQWEKVYGLVSAEEGEHIISTPNYWQSGKIGDNARSELLAKAFGSGKISFWWKVSCEQFRTYKLDHLAFYIDGVEQEPWINGDTEWSYLEFEVEGSFVHDFAWKYVKDEMGANGGDVGAVCAVVWCPRLETLEDYAGVTNLTLNTSGDAGWYGVSDVSHVWPGCVRSGKVYENQSSCLEVTVAGEGRVSFWLKTDCEQYRNLKIDHFSFCIDGIEQAWTNGVVDWHRLEFVVQGVDQDHTLSWIYDKDEEGSDGEDCVWVGEIEWIPNVVDPIPDIGDTPSEIEVRHALNGSADLRLAVNITNGVEYAAYREWAATVKSSKGSDAAGARAVKESSNAWLSFALHSNKLIETAPVQGDLKIDDFKHSATDGGFDMIVSLDGVNVGSEASKENLKKVFGIEGSTSLFGDSFSSASVDLEFGTPEKGKVKCTAVPKDKAATSFFIKMKLK